MAVQKNTQLCHQRLITVQILRCLWFIKNSDILSPNQRAHYTHQSTAYTIWHTFFECAPNCEKHKNSCTFCVSPDTQSRAHLALSLMLIDWSVCLNCRYDHGVADDRHFLNISSFQVQRRLIFTLNLSRSTRDRLTDSIDMHERWCSSPLKLALSSAGQTIVHWVLRRDLYVLFALTNSSLHRVQSI